MTSSAGGRAGEGSLQIMYGIGGEHDLSERELAAPARLARLAPGARRQRRLEPDPARRLRRAAQRAARLPRAAGRAAPGDPGASPPTSPTPPRGAGARPTRGCGRCAASRGTISRRRSCAGPRSIARSSSRRSSASTPRSRSGRPSATAIRAAILERGWSEQAGLRAVLRLRRARRGRAADADLRLPAGDRRAHALDDRGDRARADRGRPGPALPQQEGLNADGLTGEEGTFVICSFWLVSASPRPARSNAPRSCSTSSPATPTTSACWARRSTPPPASSSATSRRPTATSA